MSKYESKDLKVGLKVIIDDEPFIILEAEFRKPGKGQAFNRLKLRNLKNHKIIKKTFKIGEKLQAADFYYKEVKFLYNDEINAYFIDIISYECYEVSWFVLKNNNWFINGNIYKLVLLNGSVLNVEIPRFLVCKVISIDIYGKVNISLKNTIYAKLETGVYIQVPLFIKVNDFIKVDTEKKEYLSRIS